MAAIRPVLVMPPLLPKPKSLSFEAEEDEPLTATFSQTTPLAVFDRSRQQIPKFNEGPMRLQAGDRHNRYTRG